MKFFAPLVKKLLFCHPMSLFVFESAFVGTHE